MFCKQCGKKIEIGVTQCPHCKRPADPLSGGSGYSHLSSAAYSDPVAPQAAVPPQAPVSPPASNSVAVSPKPVAGATPAPHPRKSGFPQLLGLISTILNLILLIAVIVLAIKASGLKTQVEILSEQINVLQTSDPVSEGSAAGADDVEEATAPEKMAQEEEPPAKESVPPAEEAPEDPTETDKEPEDANPGNLGNTQDQRTPYPGSVTGSLSEAGDFTFTVDPLDGIPGDTPEYQWYVLAVDAGTNVIWDGAAPADNDDLVISISDGEPTVDLEEALSTFDWGNESEIKVSNDYFVADGYMDDIAKYYFCRVTIGADVYFTDLIQPLQELGTIIVSPSVVSSNSCSIVYNGTPYKLVLDIGSNYKASARGITLEYLWIIDGDRVPENEEQVLSLDTQVALEVRIDDGDEDTENVLIFSQTCTTAQLFPAEG